MVQNVPYFKDKGDSNSSAGWKVSLTIISILHTISAHVKSCAKHFNEKIIHAQKNISTFFTKTI